MFENLYSQTSSSASGPGGAGMQFVFIIAIFIVFYFLLIRPQQKRAKELDKRRNELKKGDKIVTAGGIYATVSHIKDEGNIVVVEIADGVKVELVKATISQIIDDPAKTAEAKK